MKTHRILPLHGAAGLTECSTLEVDARYSYPGMLFFYAEQLDEARLRLTLSQVLDDFPQYAGKLRTSAVRLQIQHGGAAATFDVAHSGSTRAALQAQLRATGRCRQLEPQVSVLGIALAREPTLLVRLTLLRDGCVLGVGWNHAVGDMHSTMLLLRAWAAAYAGRSYPKPLVLTDRDAYLRATLPNPSRARPDARRIDLLPSLALRMQLFRPAVGVTCELSNAQLDALQRSLSGTQPITRNDALCAHVYAVLRRLSPAAKQTKLCLVVNFRKRLGLPDHVIGNMTSLLAQPVRKHHSAAQIAASLRKRLNEYADKHVSYHPTARVYRASSSTGARLRIINRHFRPGSGDIFITNWDKFGVYDLAFGTSRPELFQPVVLGAAQLPQWFMIVYELPNARGLGVTLGLPKAVAKHWNSPVGQALLHGTPPTPEAELVQLHRAAGHNARGAVNERISAL
jgi:shikimate O-hydroxycinnamoyltransferase